MTETPTPYARSYAAIADFIRRWEGSGAAERANYQLFLSELCDQLQVPRPAPTRPDDKDNAYVFERTVTFRHGDGSASAGRIDLYKRGCFVLEAKQGSDRHAADPLVRETSGPRRKGTAVRGNRGWDDAMLAARGQAEQYARALPVEEGWPPFLVVLDVGHSIELYSEFSCTGKVYLPFPDPRSHRIQLAELAKAEVRERLRLAWTDPHLLDPARHSARVTREVADRLARLAKSFELSGHKPEAVGNFLKRCLFTLFAEDVGLIPKGSFTGLLESLKGEAEKFAPLAGSLWATMRDGGFSPVLREKLLRFNGGLFEEAQALPLAEEQLQLLIEAGKADWKDVEPAIFGTLLERALDPRERHNLGAHYTPREYVERLVLPTVVEPLRADWEAVLAAAVTLARQGKLAEAVAEVKAFHRKLCAVRVLDPACGSGNFLYVTFEHLKRLEGEVLNALEGFGETQAVLDLAGSVVDPHQLLGIEVNPRAAAITDMVLWIGYLQWHFRTRGDVMPPEPVIKKFRNVECRDAVLAWDGVEPVLDEQGQPVTRWDGRTTKAHPVTGEPVPDETARVPLVRYLNPRPAEWPEADFVVGNPPFIGNKRMRQALGDGYVEALRKTHQGVPESAEYVMYWWNHAANLARQGRLRRFGFITTNSLTQTFNRKVVQSHLAGKAPLSLVFAIPDHPWVDSADGAAVRIAMTSADASGAVGSLLEVTKEQEGVDGVMSVSLGHATGRINADLTVGVDLGSLTRLAANVGLACPGVQLSGQGFLVAAEQLGFFSQATRDALIRPYATGRDITQTMREQYVLDTFCLDHDSLRQKYPDAFQWLHDKVLPERAHNPREKYRREWWLHAEPRSKFRKALVGLARFAVTSRTARHRTFQFMPSTVLPETKVLVLAFDDSFHLGVLSSRIHVGFSLATGGWLGAGNDSTYNHSDCLEKFPFPACDEAQKERIRTLAEALDAHRKARQALHPGLTLTDMYNVLEKLRAGEALSAKEREVHEKGLVSVLRQLHDDLDAAVFTAYGWPTTLSDEEILERLVALNRERVREEEQGLVRWLRPEYQAPQGAAPGVQVELGLEEEAAEAAPKAKHPWPKALPEQVQVLRAALAAHDRPVTARDLAKGFERARVDKVGELLETLASLGQAREVEKGVFAV